MDEVHKTPFMELGKTGRLMSWYLGMNYDPREDVGRILGLLYSFCLTFKGKIPCAYLERDPLSLFMPLLVVHILLEP